MTRRTLLPTVFALTLAFTAPATEAHAQERHAHNGRVRVSGVVTDSAGIPLAETRVSVVDSLGRIQRGVTTGPDGWFELSDLPEGYNTFLVRRIGYRPRTFTLDIHPEMQGNVEVALSPALSQLDTVVVTASLKRSARLEEFYERKAKGFGYFVETREIQRLGKVRVTDVLRHVPGVLVTMDTRRGRVRNLVQMRDGCAPTLWYDGILMRGVDLDEIANAESIQAMEVYTSTATMPVQFRASNSSCGAIVAWSKG
jgi:hypothetical protein